MTVAGDVRVVPEDSLRHAEPTRASLRRDRGVSAAPTDGPRRNPFAAAALAWIVPGLGHWYLGRRRLAPAFFADRHADVPSGALLRGPPLHDRVGSAADHPRDVRGLRRGPPERRRAAALGDPGGTILSPTYEYGCAYLLTAGLMNLLLVLDAWDIASGRKDDRGASPDGPLPDHDALRASSRRPSSRCSGARRRARRWKLFGMLLASLVLGGLAVAWLMYPFP